MSSDFNFNVASWFLGNVRVKPISTHSAPLTLFGRAVNTISNQGGRLCQTDFPTFRRPWVQSARQLAQYRVEFFQFCEFFYYMNDKLIILLLEVYIDIWKESVNQLMLAKSVNIFRRESSSIQTKLSTSFYWR